MVTVTIYALKDPRDGSIRYVGKTKQNPSRRLTGHVNEKRSTRKCRWVGELKREGMKPEVLVLTEVPESEWERSERFWIEYCRRSGFDLTNHTDGGDGVSGLDAEARAKVSAFQKKRFENPEERRALSENKERSAKISAALKGKPKSKQHIASLPQNRPGRKLTAEHRAKISANNRGHRWSADEIKNLQIRNVGNSYGIGNRSRTGQQQSETERTKKSQTMKGRKHTSEQTEGIRQRQLSYWAKFTKEERRAELFNRLSNRKKDTTK